MNEIPEVPAQVSALEQLLNTYGWPALIGVVILVLIQVVKSDRIPISISPSWRPVVAVLGGLLAMVATRLIQGEPVSKAITGGIAAGLGAGLGAVGLFELRKSATRPLPPDATPPADQERPTDPPAKPSSAPPSANPLLRVTDPFLFGGPVRVAFGVLFALLAFGCSSVAVVDGAVTAANLAAKGERTATPILDALCAKPMTALALEPPSPARRKAFDDLTAHCDPLEGAYRQLHADREVLVDLIEAATSEEGAKVGDIIEATKKLTKSIGELAALVEEMSR